MRFKLQRESDGTARDTVGATFGSDGSDGDVCHIVNTQPSVSMAAPRGSLKPFARSTERLSMDDPLSEDTMEEERTYENQGSSSNPPMTFAQMLRSDRSHGDTHSTGNRGCIEKRAAKRGMAQHVEHWDDVDLPEFETSNATDIGKLDRRAAG